MKSIADVFRTKRQQALSGFDVYILEDGPADGKSPVRSIALDAAANVLRPCLLSVNGDTSEYELTMLLDVYGPLQDDVAEAYQSGWLDVRDTLEVPRAPLHTIPEARDVIEVDAADLVEASDGEWALDEIDLDEVDVSFD